jgi:hypothetical protein
VERGAQRHPGLGPQPCDQRARHRRVTLRGLDAKSLRARALTAAGVPTAAAIPVAASPGAFTLTLGVPAATMVLIESGRGCSGLGVRWNSLQTNKQQ